MTFGELKIVPSAPLGELGEDEGPAVTYDWKLYYSLGILGLWAVPVLFMAAFRSNRQPAAVIILIPALITAAVWLALKLILPLDSQSEEIFSILMYSLAAAIATVWLAAGALSGKKTVTRFAASVLLLTGVGSWGFVVVNAGLTDLSGQFVVMTAMLAFSIACGFLMARLCSGAAYGGAKFTGWLVLWTILAAVVVVLLVSAIQVAASGGMQNLSGLVVATLAGGSMLGIILAVINLIFLAFILKSSFYRRRFEEFLGLSRVRHTDMYGNLTPDQPGANPDADV